MKGSRALADGSAYGQGYAKKAAEGLKSFEVLASCSTLEGSTTAFQMRQGYCGEVLIVGRNPQKGTHPLELPRERDFAQLVPALAIVEINYLVVDDVRSAGISKANSSGIVVFHSA